MHNLGLNFVCGFYVFVCLALCVFILHVLFVQKNQDVLDPNCPHKRCAPGGDKPWQITGFALQMIWDIKWFQVYPKHFYFCLVYNIMLS